MPRLECHLGRCAAETKLIDRVAADGVAGDLWIPRWPVLREPEVDKLQISSGLYMVIHPSRLMKSSAKIHAVNNKTYNQLIF
jgi:hypothetical protein